MSVCIFSFFWQNNALVTSWYTYETDEIGEALDGYRIVQISDLHNKQFGKNQKRLLEKIGACTPDLIPASNEPSGCLQTFGDCRDASLMPRCLQRGC